MQATHGNAAYYFVDRHIDGEASNRAAYIEAGSGGRSLTYHHLALQTDRMPALFERHGIKPHDRAAMLVRNQLEFPIIFWGSLKAGVVPVPLGTLLKTGDYRDILQDSKAKALFVSTELFDSIEPVLTNCPDLEAVFVIEKRNAKDATPLLARLMAAKGSGSNKLAMPFSVELAKSGQRPVHPAGANDCAYMLYCPEPDGKPKGRMLVHASLQHAASGYSKQILDIQPDDIVFSSEKMSYASGLVNAMACPMSVGATTILVPAWPSPEDVLTVFREKRPTVVCCAPGVYSNILSCLRARPEGAERLRACISAGEAIPADVARRWKEIFGVDIIDCCQYEFAGRNGEAELVPA